MTRLVVMLDLLPSAWAKMDLPTTVHQVLIFLNAHLAMDSSNTVAVIASLPKTSRMIYPTSSQSVMLPSEDSGKIEKFASMNDIVASQLDAAYVQGTSYGNLDDFYTICLLNVW
eukprot:m.563723 g.563723  ORF g.563723 m.563723 type:complete len:114 (+) comp22235_c0_seq11:323-664(+)